MAHSNLDYAPTAISSAPEISTFARQIGVGCIVGERYRVVRFVAQGAFGAVYQAHDLEVPGHIVALKLMHREPASQAERHMHEREVRLVAAVSHPSVVSFKDHGLHEGRLYLVMPWYDGETLATRLTRGPLSRGEAQRIFQQLAQALSAVHERGIRHQDVKPENILLARFGAGEDVFPVLLDLGVGAFNHEFVPAFTPAYVAPEMARAHLEITEGRAGTAVDAKSDVYALVLTLFDALAPDARPIASCDSSHGALAQRSRRGVSLPERPELADLAASFARWLAVDPAERPSAHELARELCVLTRAEHRRAERKRAARRGLPLLAATLVTSLLLGFQLHSERMASRAKDAVIEAQAAQLDGSREAQVPPPHQGS
jgi:serine/threonine protein kinase